MDWLDLLAVQGTLKSLLQHHSSRASILQHSAFFIVQLSHPHMTTEKTIALTRLTFVGKGMSLLFDMLSRFLMTLFSKGQASFNFMAEVIICNNFGTQENKVWHCFHCFPIYFPWSDGAKKKKPSKCIRLKELKLNIGVNLHDLESGNGFLNYDTKSTSNQRNKTDEVRHQQNEKLLCFKDTIKKVKR